MAKFVPPKKCIGPSQLAVVLGISERFCTRNLLKTRLENGYMQDSPTDAMQFGIDHEQVARNFYQKHHKITVQKANFVRGAYFNKNYRLVGIADGLVGSNGGIEIKCHMNKDVCHKIPSYYMTQIVAYMFLYKRQWWDFVSCSFTDGKLKKCKIIRVYWKNHQNTWFQDWYPKIIEFIKSVKWQQ